MVTKSKEVAKKSLLSPRIFLSLENQTEYSENSHGLNHLMFSPSSFAETNSITKTVEHSTMDDGSYIPIRHTHPRGSWVFMKGYGQRILTPQGKKLMCLFPKCGRMYVDANGSTNGLKSHLLKVHKVTSEDNPSDFSQVKMSPFPLKPNLMKSTTFLPSSTSSLQSCILREALVELLASNGLPPRLSNDESILKILRLAQPSGELFNMQQELAQSFSDTKAKLKKLLIQQPSISLSITHWESHIALTAHFITDTWESKHILLALLSAEPQVSIQLAQAFMKVLDDFNITSLITSITSDTTAPMVLLVQELGKIAVVRRDFDFVPSQHHIPCLAHIITCAVNDALKTADKGSFQVRLEKLRNGIASIRSSPVKLDSYQRFFIHRHCAYRELLLDDSTRWYTTHRMLDCIQDVYEAYNEARLHGDHASAPLTQDDMDSFEELKNFLGPFQALIARIASSGYPAISKSCLLYEKMLLYLSAPSPQKPVCIQQANHFARQAFSSQFSKLQANSIFPLAAALDPRVKFSYWKPPLYSTEDTERFIAIVQSFWDRSSGQDASSIGQMTSTVISASLCQPLVLLILTLPFITGRPIQQTSLLFPGWLAVSLLFQFLLSPGNQSFLQPSLPLLPTQRWSLLSSRNGSIF
ncbi:hypothetical protein DSO57_1039633 [Entomophthora muscae]|uniref:Uncharacterized protein n=1 Tax=Entomophthora muscae TaxID=34485 RepID=A0ACC2U7D0_9FUNG|nr:hypothetical protein DSO57_1039633 [Entomophthora muscae]